MSGSSSSGAALLVALLLIPLVGAILVAFLRDNDRLAKLVALGFSIVEFVVMVVSWCWSRRRKACRTWRMTWPGAFPRALAATAGCR